MSSVAIIKTPHIYVKHTQHKIFILRVFNFLKSLLKKLKWRSHVLHTYDGINAEMCCLKMLFCEILFWLQATKWNEF